MNETMSLLLVATVLAIGGAGLYIYKFEDESVGDGGSNEYSENYNEDDFEEDIILEPKTKSKGSKTKRNRKNSSSKRRY